MSSRRRESSRSYQLSHAIKRNSILTGELIELYTPRASLSPYAHHHRYSRQLSIPRGVPTTGPARPLYISPSISPYSQLSIHSQTAVRQRSPSPQIFRQSQSRLSYTPTTPIGSLRPCYSAPRLHLSHQRIQTNNTKQTDKLIEETSSSSSTQYKKKRSATVIQRQDAVFLTNDNEHLSAEMKRNILKETAIESTGSVWLKRSNSS